MGTLKTQLLVGELSTEISTELKDTVEVENRLKGRFPLQPYRSEA